MARGVHVDIPDKKKISAARARHRRRAAYLLKQYGITQAEYLEMIRQQGGKCAICGRRSIKLHIDHDHASGQVRGLLCMTCNTALGKFGDNVDWLIEAARYVSRAWLAAQKAKKTCADTSQEKTAPDAV